MRAVTRAEIQDIDRRATSEYGIPELTLMENAGRAAAEVILREFAPRAATVICGVGNNGGDGFVIARHLEAAGARAHVYALGPESAYRGAALANHRRVRPGPLVWSDVVVDAIFGVGLNRPVAGATADLIREMNEHSPIVAVDIPSGLDADSGLPLGVAVRADVTVTMGLAKVGLLRPHARAYVGRLIVVDIGYPPALAGA